jgi:hypothetical protein
MILSFHTAGINQSSISGDPWALCGASPDKAENRPECVDCLCAKDSFRGTHTAHRRKAFAMDTPTNRGVMSGGSVQHI